jgi:hypothetical protein
LIADLDSVEHYNKLVELKRDYAVHRRKIIKSYEDSHKISQNGVAKLKYVIQAHDRKSASKRFPASLIPGLPAILTKPFFS